VRLMWTQVADLHELGGRYWDRTSDLLGVNYRRQRAWSAPGQHSEPLTVRRHPQRSAETRGCCCTSLLYITVSHRRASARPAGASRARARPALVNPGCPVQPGARWVHGSSDEQLVDAPPLAEAWPRLLEVTADRTVLGYNAEFDHDTVIRHALRDGLDLRHLLDTHRWSCLMSQRPAWLMRHSWLLLGGGHRARADCEVAIELLAAMTAPALQPKADADKQPDQACLTCRDVNLKRRRPPPAATVAKAGRRTRGDAAAALGQRPN